MLLFESKTNAGAVTDPQEGATATPAATRFSAWGTGDIPFDQAGGTGSTVIQYDTGYLGNRGAYKTGFYQATGRHTDASNFLLTDGQVKWLRGSQVSSGGQNAIKSTDPQGATSGGSSAAGSDDGQYIMTMSVV